MEEVRNSIEVAAGLIFRGDRLLITRRFDEAHLGGLWEFPGGKRERDESFEQCLVRELREELGIEVFVGELVQEITHQYPEKSVYLRFFRCEWRSNEPRAIGCAAIAWVKVDELKQYSFPAADEQLLEHLRTDPSLWTPSRRKS